MNLSTAYFFAMQEDLDAHIANQQQQQQEETVQKRLLALQVELGELANETRCFKFWSIKPSAEKSTILEEYVDGLHFILSLGLSYNYRPDEVESNQQEENLVAAFLAMYDVVSAFRRDPGKDLYQKIFSIYMNLAELLGFNKDDIHKAYKQKNETNHERQDSGY